MVGVPGGTPIGQIAVSIGGARPDQRDVRPQRALQNPGLPIEFNELFALLGHCAQAGFHQDTSQPHATGPDALGDGAHGAELHLNFPRCHQRQVFRHRPGMGHNDLIKNPHVHQPGGAGIQGDVGQVLGPAGNQTVQQFLCTAMKGKATGHDGLAVVKF